MAGPFESLAQSSGSAGNVAGGLMRGFAEGLQEQSAKQLSKELADRKALAEKFRAIADDKTYPEDARTAADRHYVTLTMLPLEKKRPKEYQPDKAYNGLPRAYFEVTYKKVMRDGPQEPKEPAAPSMPGSMGMPGEAPDPSTSQIPSPPSVGPDGMQATPGSAAGAAPALPPMPDLGIDFSSYEPTRRSDLEMAREQGAINSAGRTIPVAPEVAKALGLPEGTAQIDSTLLQNLRLTEDRQARLLARGFNDDGTPLPWKQQLDAAKIGLQNAQAEAQRAIASGKPEEAASRLLAANAAMLAAQASMERATNPMAGGIGTFFPVVDASGVITGGVNNKTWQTVGPPDVPGARKSAIPAGSVDRQASIRATMQKLEELDALGRKHAGSIGPIKGRVTDVALSTIGLEGDINELFRLSDDIADELLRARSGAAITESEYSRLRKLVPDPRAPLSKFNSDLKGFRTALSSLSAAREDVLAPRPAIEGVDPKPTIPAKTYDDAVAKFGADAVAKKYTRGN